MGVQLVDPEAALVRLAPVALPGLADGAHGGSAVVRVRDRRVACRARQVRADGELRVGAAAGAGAGSGRCQSRNEVCAGTRGCGRCNSRNLCWV